MNAAPVERRMYPRKDAAYYLGISLRSLDYLGNDGKIAQTRIAGRVLYDQRDLDAYVEKVKRAS